MCRSAAEGGQRCAAHTRPRFNAATFGTPEWDEAAADYASTGEGNKHLNAMAFNARDAADLTTDAACTSAIRRGHNRRLAVLETRQILNDIAGHGNRIWHLFAGSANEEIIYGEEHALQHTGCKNLTPIDAKEDLTGEYFAILMPNDEIGLVRKGQKAFEQMADFITGGPFERGKPVRFNLDYADTPTAA